MSEQSVPIDGVVLYPDGSFRRGLAGWGLHGYTYVKKPLTRGIGVKQLPTTEGYQLVSLENTVTPVEYIDSFGTVDGKATNNTGELQAAIEALKLAVQLDVPDVYILVDSEYVRKGLTSWIKGWVKNGWLTKQGEPVNNQELWKELKGLYDEWKASDKKFSIVWVKGHSNDLGNELADLNAKNGSGIERESMLNMTSDAGYHNPKSDANPLDLKTRMLFNIGGKRPTDKDGGHYYYLYSLGRMSTYGHKQDDTLRERHNKTDLLLGRRISDAIYCVLRLEEPDSYLEQLMSLHSEAHCRDRVDLAVARLDNAYKPAVQQRIMRLGEDGLMNIQSNQSLTTPTDDLITKTLDPPHLSREAVARFQDIQENLQLHLSDKIPQGVQRIDITDQFYALEELPEKSKKTPKNKLHPTITNTTPYIEVPVSFNGTKLNVRLVLGIDIPQRNPLNKLAATNPRVHLLLIAVGPECYSFATVFDSDVGSAIYQSPYTQFVVPQ